MELLPPIIVLHRTTLPQRLNSNINPRIRIWTYINTRWSQFAFSSDFLCGFLIFFSIFPFFNIFSHFFYLIFAFIFRNSSHPNPQKPHHPIDQTKQLSLRFLRNRFLKQTLQNLAIIQEKTLSPNLLTHYSPHSTSSSLPSRPLLSINPPSHITP
jgi:hypothetical protein